MNSPEVKNFWFCLLCMCMGGVFVLLLLRPFVFTKQEGYSHKFLWRNKLLEVSYFNFVYFNFVLQIISRLHDWVFAWHKSYRSEKVMQNAIFYSYYFILIWNCFSCWSNVWLSWVWEKHFWCCCFKTTKYLNKLQSFGYLIPD